jgi:hypothetical protein
MDLSLTGSSHVLKTLSLEMQALKLACVEASSRPPTLTRAEKEAKPTPENFTRPLLKAGDVVPPLSHTSVNHPNF